MPNARPLKTIPAAQSLRRAAKNKLRRAMPDLRAVVRFVDCDDGVVLRIRSHEVPGCTRHAEPDTADSRSAVPADGRLLTAVRDTTAHIVRWALAAGVAQSAVRALSRRSSKKEHVMSKTDMQLKRDVEEELRWDPRVNAVRIGVAVEMATVWLLGSVDTYPEKWAAEDAVKRVSGVRAFADDLTVKVLTDHARSDADIDAAAQSVLTWDVLVPPTVRATVHHGVVTLKGEASWNYQREAAERAVRYLTGVVTVDNAITLNPHASAAQVKEKIQAALQRQAMSDVKSIHVETSGGTVTLTGHASSWQSIEDATNAAWAAPGVTEVIDQVKMSVTLG